MTIGSPGEDLNSEIPASRNSTPGAFFVRHGREVEDDHVSLLRRGVNAVEGIDFDSGPNHTYWHTEQDALDRLSAESLQVVGRVLLEVVRKLECQCIESLTIESLTIEWRHPSALPLIVNETIGNRRFFTGVPW